MSNVCDVLELGPRAAGRLGTLGVHSVGDLLRANLSALADENYSVQTLAAWQREARLRTEIPQLEPMAARVLSTLGVHSAEVLRRKSPTDLVSKWEEMERTHSTPSWLAAEKKPAIADLCAWIATAQDARAESAA